MKILVKQTVAGVSDSTIALEKAGIEQCYLKYITQEKDRCFITLKRHHHASFEVHIMERGYAIYEIGDQRIRVSEGQLLLIPPLIKHAVIENSEETAKYSITFCVREGTSLAAAMSLLGSPVCCKTPPILAENIRAVCEEQQHKKYGYLTLIYHRMLECILQFARMGGAMDGAGTDSEADEDLRLKLAKQYIRDNVCQAVTVSDVASYCALSNKQMTRIFKQEEGMAVAEYIRRERCLFVEKMICDSELSLRQISEQMNFSNEYYFNAYFKKYVGMSPGAYRRSVKK